eukprot:TRINITY_DN3044_c0_g2_i1.p1 TRINITY_DN3044_c0_g2~~TRINITY_DN3044_c0_g2_i1.p1  ORF type:complete len:704 (-),score=142.43 TRINITY_DN3044_c0_g2_i1:41-1879(-)
MSKVVKSRVHNGDGGAMLPEEGLTSEYMGMCLWAWSPKRWSDSIAATGTAAGGKSEEVCSKSDAPAAELAPIDVGVTQRFERKMAAIEAANAPRDEDARIPVDKFREWFEAMKKADEEIRSLTSLEASTQQAGDGAGCLFESGPPASGPRVLPKVRTKAPRVEWDGSSKGARKPASSSVVSLHIGDEGCGTGLASWQRIFSQHCLAEDGRAEGDFYGSPSLLFAESVTGRFVPRTVFAGYGADQLDCCRKAGMFAPTSILTGSSQVGASFGEGLLDNAFKDEVLDLLRQHAEQADFLSGFLLTHSSGEDARTNGFTQNILQGLSCAFGKSLKFTVTGVAAGEDELAAKANSGLLSGALVEHTDVVSFYDRPALKKLAADKEHGLGLPCPDTAACHGLVARLVSGITSPLRFSSLVPASEGARPSDLRALAANLVCYPRIKFTVPGLGGLKPEAMADFLVDGQSGSATGANAVLASLTRGHMSSVMKHGALGEKVIAVSLLARGVAASTCLSQVEQIKCRRDVPVVDWCPTAFTLFNVSDPKGCPPEVVALMHDTAAGKHFATWAEALEGSSAQDLSVESGEFEDAKENLHSLRKDYEEVGVETAEEEGDEEY